MSLTLATQALKSHFGFNQLKPTQHQAMEAVFAGRDVLVVMPTGGGKSLCYQLPALVLPGTAIVISPLIALMKDQVDSLKAYSIAAKFLNSSQSADEQAEVIEQLQQGNLDLLYVSAEKAVSTEFIKLLQQIKVNLFAVDEAHCISNWGHDFRPNYNHLSHLKSQFPEVPVIALTATADLNTRQDIMAQLAIEDSLQLIDSFDRPNIRLTVLPAQERFQQIAEFLQDHPGQSGIIYCLTRNQTEKLAKKIQGTGVNAAAYHAGMSSTERELVQQSFIRDKTQVICATIAFGMGIDKLNIRWVVHYNMPKSVENYYQEIGRAGRDGQPAEAVLFYTFQDVELLKKLVLTSSQRSLQMAKILRMKDYAESVICRRRTLLSYFGEYTQTECGNCDICDRPYQTVVVDSILNNKLFEIISLSELVSQLTDDLPYRSAEIRFFISQLLNMGIIELTGPELTEVKLTEYGQEQVNTGSVIELVRLSSFIERLSD